MEPRKVGTSAAFGGTSPIKLPGWQELTISCFKSFTKWSLPMWGYLQNKQHKTNKKKTSTACDHSEGQLEVNCSAKVGSF